MVLDADSIFYSTTALEAKVQMAVHLEIHSFGGACKSEQPVGKTFLTFQLFQNIIDCHEYRLIQKTRFELCLIAQLSKDHAV